MKGGMSIPLWLKVEVRERRHVGPIMAERMSPQNAASRSCYDRRRGCKRRHIDPVRAEGTKPQ
jgi:hypothetical protein